MKNEISIELEKINKDFIKERKQLRLLQKNEGITKIIYNSCYIFNLGNSLTNEEYMKLFS